MIVVASAAGPTLDDAVDERFGRAKYFVAVDPDTGEIVKSIDNSANREAQGGAGTGSAEIVSELGAVAVLTGHLGPKAFAALEIAGIPGYAAVGRSVSEAVKAYVAKELETLTAGPAGIKP